MRQSKSVEFCEKTHLLVAAALKEKCPAENRIPSRATDRYFAPLSVPNLHAKTTAVVAVVIIIDGQDQTTVNGNGGAQLAAY